jgi:hypothetical protein
MLPSESVFPNLATQEAVLLHRRQYCPNHASQEAGTTSQEAVLPQSCLTGSRYYLTGGSTAAPIMPHRKQVLPHRRQYCPNHASQEAGTTSQEAVLPQSCLTGSRYYLTGGMQYMPQSCLTGGSTAHHASLEVGTT